MRKAKSFAFLVTLIITLALLMTPLGLISQFSAESTDTQVTATTDTFVKQGNNGYCYVYIDSLEDLSSLIVTVHYDPSKVYVTADSVINVVPSLLYDKGAQNDSVQFSYIFDGNGNAEKSQLFYFEYTVLDTAGRGESYFDIVVSEAYDSNLTAMPIVGSRCAFSVLSSTDTVSHNYTRQVISDTYKKSDATCTSPAIYYYCCDTCDAAGTATFEYGSALGHTGGIPNCVSSAICDRCYQPYGGLLDHIYTDQEPTVDYLKFNATCRSGAVYYKNCAVCGKAGPETFEFGATKDHSFTKQVIADTYKVMDASCISASIYKYCCAFCDTAGTTTFEFGNALGHTGGTATCTAQAECVRCHQPYGNILDHVYTDEDATVAYLKSEATCTSKAVYFKNCSTCDKAGTETFEYGSTKDHSYSRQVIADSYKKNDATCTSPTVYYYCCETCDSIGIATFEFGNALDHTGGTATCTAQAECILCHQPYGNILDHVYTDEDPTSAYLKSDATCTSNAVYYKNCATCDKAGTDTFEFGIKNDHNYTNDCDTDCNACGYVRTVSHRYNTEWTNDAENHWIECSICGDMKNKATHVPGLSSTETTDQTCTVCGYIISETIDQSYNYNKDKEDASSDETVDNSSFIDNKNNITTDSEDQFNYGSLILIFVFIVVFVPLIVIVIYRAKPKKGIRK